MISLFKKVTRFDVNEHSRKMAWNCFINAGGFKTATVEYWLDQLSAYERQAIIQKMNDYSNSTGAEND